MIKNIFKPAIGLMVSLFLIAACNRGDGEVTTGKQGMAHNDSSQTGRKDTISPQQEDGPPQKSKPLDEGKRVYLMDVDIGGPYSDSWEGAETKRDSANSTVFITLFRDGKSGDFRVDMTINCSSGEYHYSDGTEFEDSVVPADLVKDSIPDELPGKAINTFCKK